MKVSSDDAVAEKKTVVCVLDSRTIKSEVVWVTICQVDVVQNLLRAALQEPEGDLLEYV